MDKKKEKKKDLTVKNYEPLNVNINSLVPGSGRGGYNFECVFFKHNLEFLCICPENIIYLYLSNREKHSLNSFRLIVGEAVWFHKSWTPLVLALAQCWLGSEPL